MDRSSVQKMPVLMRSQRFAWRPGTIALKSMRMYSGFRQRRLAISLPRSTLRPFSSPLASTNCIGGSVGLIDIVSLPASITTGGATFGAQAVCASAGAAPTRPRIDTTNAMRTIAAPIV